jgi:hypothetical protein
MSTPKVLNTNTCVANLSLRTSWVPTNQKPLRSAECQQIVLSSNSSKITESQIPRLNRPSDCLHRPPSDRFLKISFSPFHVECKTKNWVKIDSQTKQIEFGIMDKTWVECVNASQSCDSQNTDLQSPIRQSAESRSSQWQCSDWKHIVKSIRNFFSVVERESEPVYQNRWIVSGEELKKLTEPKELTEPTELTELKEQNELTELTELKELTGSDSPNTEKPTYYDRHCVYEKPKLKSREIQTHKRFWSVGSMFYSDQAQIDELDSKLTKLLSLYFRELDFFDSEA